MIEIPSEIKSDLEQLRDICSLFYKTAGDKFWGRRNSELWEFAFSRLIAPDILIARGLVSEEMTLISPEQWFKDEKNDLLIQFQHNNKSSFKMIIMNSQEIVLELSYSKNEKTLSINRQFHSDHIFTERTLIVAMLSTRLALEYNLINGNNT